MSDVWNFYLTQTHPEPGIVFLDLGLKAEVPLDGFDYVVVLEVELTRLRDNGMPEPSELERLNELEDYMMESLPAETAVFIARKTLAGRRDFYFYSSNATLAEQLISQAMAGFPEYQFELRSSADPMWTTYEELYPNAREVQTINNHEVISALKSSGDALLPPRKITHWMYFRTDNDRARFCQALAATGFRLSHETETIPGREFPYGQVVEHQGSVDVESIDEAVLQLYDLTREYDGDYDGWETVVVQSDDQE